MSKNLIRVWNQYFEDGNGDRVEVLYAETIDGRLLKSSPRADNAISRANLAIPGKPDSWVLCAGLPNGAEFVGQYEAPAGFPA